MNGYQNGHEPKKKSPVWLIVIIVCGTFILIGGTCITGILAAIIVPGFLNVRAEAQIDACSSNMKNIATALEMYATDYEGNYPPSLNYLTEDLGSSWSPYMKKLPVCPTCQKPYIYQNTSTEDEDSFLLTCGEINCHVSRGGVGDGYFPQYTPGQGLTYE